MGQSRKLFLLLGLLLGIFSSTAFGQALTLVEQCPSLTSKPGTAEEVTRALEALKSKEAKTRIEAAQKLSASCDRRAVAPLSEVLKDDDALVRVAAVEALGHLGDNDSIQPLIDLIPDKDWRVSMALGRALCSFQTYESSEAALNALANPSSKGIADENDLRARCVTLVLINQLRDVRFSRKATTFLLNLLEDNRESYRKIAEQYMLELKNTRNGSHELIGILKQNNNPAFRQQAAYWLGKLGIELARRALGEASVGDADARVRKTAAEALALLPKEGIQ